MNKFAVEITTPEKTLFEGETESLVLQTPNGKIGIMAGRAPVLIALDSGIIKISSEGETPKEAVTSKGFALVKPDKTIIMCGFADWKEEAEDAAHHRAKQDAERQQREKQSYIEFKSGKADLMRAFERLKEQKN